MWDEDTVVLPALDRTSDPSNAALPITAAGLPGRRKEVIVGFSFATEKAIRNTIIIGGILLTTAVFLMISSLLG